MSLKILADSVSDIPKELREKLDIEIVPLEVNFKERSYKDQIELESKTFYEMLSASEDVPTTSQVNPGEFMKVFEKHLKSGDQVLLFTLSSKLSGTYSAAVTAKDLLEAGDEITIIDSRSVSLGYGLMVIEAAEMNRQGMDKSRILDQIKNRIDAVENIFIFDTLKYLHKGGRLSKGEAVIGGLLNIKPVLTVSEGVLKPVDKVRGRKKTIQWVVDKMKDSGIDFTKQRVAIYHGDDYAYMLEFKKAIEEALGVQEWVIGEVGAVVGTHGGPGCIGVSYVSKE